MNFGFTEEQEFLRQEARKFLDDNCPIETVRKIVETKEGFSSDLWKQIGEHVIAQAKGRELWYSHYKIRIAKVESDYELDP